MARFMDERPPAQDTVTESYKGAEVVSPSASVATDEWAMQQVRERRFLINRLDEWVYDLITPYLGNRILEVGCGMGNLVRALLARELVVGIDLEPKVISHLRQAYCDQPNVQFHSVDISDPRVLELASYSFDTIVSLNVLEHVEDDLLALTHMRQLIGPAGNLVLIVPAHSWLYGTMDRSIGHHRRYDKATMAEKLAEAGLEAIMQTYMNSLGALGWFVNGRILRQTVPPSGQLKLFNLITPVLRAVERVLPVPVGISLVTVARAKA
mgnify:CR=1 FL=1